MPKAVLTISSRNYGAWALRGWLMAKLAKLDFTEHVMPPDDPAMKAEILLLSSSMLVPSLQHQGLKVWDTLAIGEYLHEIKPKAGLLPADDRRARALPRHLRRDAFGLQLAALGAADEHQGPFPEVQGVVARAGRHRPHRRDLEGVPGHLRRALPVRRAPLHGRRDVRAGGHALPDL
jgi:hypothetical protein